MGVAEYFWKASPSKKILQDLVKKKCKILQDLTSKKMHKIETVIIQDLALIITRRSCHTMHDLEYNVMQKYSRLYRSWWHILTFQSWQIWYDLA